MTMINAMNRSLSFFRPLKAVDVDTQSQMVHYYQLYYYHFSLCFLPDVWQETQSEKAQLPYIWSWRLNWMSLLSQTWWWRTLAPMLSSHARLITKMDRTMTAKVRRIIWLRAILLLNWGYSESTIPKLLSIRTFYIRLKKMTTRYRENCWLMDIFQYWEKDIGKFRLDSKPVSSDIYLLIDEWSFFLPDNSIFWALLLCVKYWAKSWYSCTYISLQLLENCIFSFTWVSSTKQQYINIVVNFGTLYQN